MCLRALLTLSSRFFYFAVLLNDDDADLCLEQHLNATRLECCVCFSYGWTCEETLVMEEDQNIIISKCGHSICKKCLFVITRKLQKNNHGKLLNVKCPFPYEQCFVNIPKKEWQIFKLNGTEVSCTNCKEINFVQDFSKPLNCWNCSRYSCIMCDEETCICNIIEAPKRFSRHIFVKGMPIRMNEITEEMKLNYNALVNKDIMECPTCKIKFHKISACNEIHHCGNLRICNLCRFTSFPWENQIPLDHWQTCFRWDYLIDGYKCIDNCNGCENHEESQQIYVKKRKELSI